MMSDHMDCKRSHKRLKIVLSIVEAVVAVMIIAMAAIDARIELVQKLMA